MDIEINERENQRMIFLSAFTQSVIIDSYKHKRRAGQFLEEYKWLLKSINRIYPDTMAVLFNFEGIINVTELKKIHNKLIVFNWNKSFKPELGIDLNYLRVLKETLDMFNDDIVMLDPDCLVVKEFDNLLKDDVDITAVTRGWINWNGFRQDIIFAPAIYHKNRKEVIHNYINYLFKESYKLGYKTNDWWANVQPAVTKIYLDAGIDLTVDFNGFPSHYGSIKLQGIETKLKVVPQYILSYPIQDEKYYPETCIIHYKNYKDRSTPEKVFKQWGERKN